MYSADHEQTKLMSKSGISTLVRFVWTAIGPIAILMLAVAILRRPVWSLGPLDALFWLATTCTVLLRYIDFTRLEGQPTSTRATANDLLRYVTGLSASAALLWLSVQWHQL